MLISFIIIILYFIDFINTEIILNAIAYAEIEQLEISSFLVNDFNQYSKKNNLNITINLNLITPLNTTAHTNDFYFEIDSILKRRSNRYDLIFYPNTYTPSFEKHFIDLKEWLPESHIQMFKNIESETFYYNNKLIGLPYFMLYSVIYYNKNLLMKYKKEKPRTWEELYETGKYILEQEKNNNNNDIIIYSGAFSYNELGMGSLYEFIYSFRDNINDPFPDLRSKNSINALKMMKKIKTDLSNDKYSLELEHMFPRLQDGNALFIKISFLNYNHNKAYSTMILPGKKEGISGTFIGGENISVNRYINQEKKEASVKALMYMTSKDAQRRAVKKFYIYSGISSLYDEKEICEIENICEIYKSAQIVEKPLTISNDYYQYSERFVYYIHRYLYGDDSVDPEKMLRKIDDITRIHYISINSKYSNEGKIIATVYLLLAFIIILSSLLLFIKKYKYNFNFLSKESWILSLIGYILLIYISFLDLEKVSVFKCHLKILFQFISFSFIFIPVLHKLISNFPEENKYSYWINKHTKLFISIFIIIDLIIYVLMFIQPYKIENVIVTNDKNFQRCKLGGLSSRLLLSINLIIKYFIFIIMLFLLFEEWNLRSLLFDIRFYSYTLSIDALLIIMMNIFELININHYSSYFIIRELIIILFVISNYISSYLIRMFWSKIYDIKSEDYYYEKFNISSIDSTPSYLRKFNYDSEITNTLNNYNNYNSIRSITSNTTNTTSSTDITNKPNISNIKDNVHNKILNILKYHYRERVMSSDNGRNKISSLQIGNNGIHSSKNYIDRMSFSRNHYNNIYFANYQDRIILSKNDENEIQSNNKIINKKSSMTKNLLVDEIDISLSNSNSSNTSLSGLSLINLSSSNNPLLSSKENIKNDDINDK